MVVAQNWITLSGPLTDDGREKNGGQPPSTTRSGGMHCTFNHYD